MRYLFLILTFGFSAQLEVEGNLSVNGTVNANGNPVTNVGVPTSLNDAINGNVLQDALRDDGNYEYKMYMTVITITSQLGDASPRWKELQPGINPNVAGWNTQFHDELFICLNDGWIISQIINYPPHGYMHSYAMYVLKRPI